VLRPSLLPGLLLAAERNAARRVRTIALFEIGTAFEPAWHDDPRGGRLPREHLRAAIVLAGERVEGWAGPRGFDLYDATGTLEALAVALGAPAPALTPSPREELHPGRSAAVTIDGGEIGIAGELHPRLARALDLEGRVAVFEIELAPLFASVRRPQAGAVPRFPAAERDLAVVVGEGTAAGGVRGAIEGTGGPSLESIDLFDVYRGEQVGAGNVSLAYRLTFRDPERTLTDDEVSAVMERIVSAIRERGWRLRE
jgi:phenylalanyl-tRNA synthetase beta chain